jgi:hypothetical protein
MIFPQLAGLHSGLPAPTVALASRLVVPASLRLFQTSGRPSALGVGSGVEVTATDSFQRQRFVDDGVFDSLDFSASYPTATWQHFLNAAKEHV